MNQPELQMIETGRLHESKSNSRRAFDKAAMDELTESIREKGIMDPLQVRSNGYDYDVFAGARRLRAAISLKIAAVPCRVWEITAEEAAELGMVNNLQRQDVHPLDEAEGYKRLLDTKRYDVAALAAKVGKSASYIHQRLALNTLIPFAKEELWGEHITLGHALLLAKLQTNDQKEMLRQSCYGSVAELQEKIQRNVMCVLDATAFDKKDSTHVVKAGDCTTCPKRTGFNKELFADIAKKDRCTDPACFQAKIDAHLARIRDDAAVRKIHVINLSGDTYCRTNGVTEKAESWPDDDGWRIAKGGCTHVEHGLIVRGEGVGRVHEVCREKTCTACNPGYKKDHYGTSSSRNLTPAARYERRLAIWENKIEQEARTRLRAAVLPLIKGPVKRWHLLALLRETMDASGPKYGESFEDEAKSAGLKWPRTQRVYDADDIKRADKLLAKADDNQILRFIFAIATHRDMIHDPSCGRTDIELLTPLIALHGGGNIDAKKIETQVRKELERKKPKPPKVKAEAKISTKVKPTKKGST